MRAALERLERQLGARRPEILTRLRPGLDAGELAAEEARLGHPLPDALRALWSWRDGLSGKGTLPAAGQRVRAGVLLPLRRAVDLALDSPLRDRWPDGWLPLVDAGNGDGLAVDLRTVGPSVREWRHEETDWPELHANPVDWISAVAVAVEELASEDPGRLTPWSASGPPLPEDPSEAMKELERRLRDGRIGRDRLLAAHLAGDSRASRVLGTPPLQVPTDWEDLRRRILDLAKLGRSDLLTRIALGAGPPPVGPHPVLADLRTALVAWCLDPGRASRDMVQRALDARSRTFVRPFQVDIAAQEAGRSVVSPAGTAARATTPVLTVLAASLGSSPSAASFEELERLWSGIREAIAPWALGERDPLAGSGTAEVPA